MSAVTGTIATFRQSFEVSLDGVHWSKAITAPFPNACTPATASACAPGTPDVRVYARWIPLPKVEMARVHLDGMTGPYRIQAASTRAQPVCESGASYPLPSSGFPVTIRAAEPGGRFPMTCTWVVQAVVARAPGSTPAYEIVQSNPASVTLTFHK